MRLGEKWSLGIYQDILDDAPPDTKLKDNSFYEFLVPEQHVSLKLLFDNLRNYGICAAFAALGAWLWLMSEGGTVRVYIPSWLPLSSAIACWTLVVCLLFLNVIQTWIISNELFMAIRAIHTSRIRVYRPTKAPLFAALALVHMFASLISHWFVLLVIRLFAVILVLLCASFVAYAILASPAVRGAA